MGNPIERRRPFLTSSDYADIQVELTLLIFRELLPTVLLGCVTMVLLTAVMAQSSKDRGLWAFTGLMAFASILRIAVVVAFYRRRPGRLTQPRALRWRIRFNATTLFYCLSFAAGTLYTLRYANAASCLLAIMGTFSLAALFSAHVGSHRWLAQTCTISMLGALALGFFLRRGELALAGIVLIVAFAYVQCRSVRVRFEGLAESIRTKRKLRLLAERDALTGLANRYLLQQSLVTICEEQTDVALFFLDLDGFKQVNDLFGHATGDALLQQVARRLQDAVRLSDFVARLGGDEFAILQAPIAGEQTALALAQRLNQAIAEPFHIDGHTISIGVSIGIHLSQTGQDDPTRLLSIADAALYQVKRSGGGGFRFASQTTA